MDNRLFIVCPFSCMETFLQYKYGHDIYFLTYSGAIVQNQESEFIAKVEEFIFRESIKSIYIVNDTSCRFINGIINKNTLFGLSSEKVMEALYIEHYFSEFKDQSLCNQKYKLAELNVKNQIKVMLNSPLLGSCIAKFDIEVKGIITSREKELCQLI